MFLSGAGLTIHCIKLVNDELFNLSKVLHESTKLHCFTLRAQVLELYSPHDPGQGYLLPANVQPLLSIETLTTLVLDLPDTTLSQGNSSSQNIHLCCIIGKLLGTLHSLHLRLPFICQVALTPPDPNQRLDLESVILNLNISSPELSGRYFGHTGDDGPTCARDCHPSWRSLPKKMKRSLIDLQTMMKAPKTLRLVEHSSRSPHCEATDLLSGENFEIREGAPWDGDRLRMNRGRGYHLHRLLSSPLMNMEVHPFGL